MGVLYNQVADQLQGLIRDGVYREGERLPGVRVLSRQFGVSISTKYCSSWPFSDNIENLFVNMVDLAIHIPTT